MKLSIPNLFIALTLLVSSAILFSCEPAARSASQAFDNANSVISSGSEKLFQDPEATEAPVVATYSPGK